VARLVSPEIGVHPHFSQKMKTSRPLICRRVSLRSGHAPQTASAAGEAAGAHAIRLSCLTNSHADWPRREKFERLACQVKEVFDRGSNLTSEGKFDIADS
jgi:hypothetical protein